MLIGAIIATLLVAILLLTVSFLDSEGLIVERVVLLVMICACNGAIIGWFFS